MDSRLICQYGGRSSVSTPYLPAASSPSAKFRSSRLYPAMVSGRRGSPVRSIAQANSLTYSSIEAMISPTTTDAPSRSLGLLMVIRCVRRQEEPAHLRQVIQPVVSGADRVPELGFLARYQVDRWGAEQHVVVLPAVQLATGGQHAGQDLATDHWRDSAVPERTERLSRPGTAGHGFQAEAHGADDRAVLLCQGGGSGGLQCLHTAAVARRAMAAPCSWLAGTLPAAIVGE